MCRCLKDRPLVILEYPQPRVQVAGVIRPRLELGHDAEIGAQEAAPELGNEFFAGTFGACPGSAPMRQFRLNE